MSCEADERSEDLLDLRSEQTGGAVPVAVFATLSARFPMYADAQTPVGLAAIVNRAGIGVSAGHAAEA